MLMALSMVFGAGCVMVATWSCSATVDEASRSADLLLKALLAPIFGYSRANELRIQLQLFLQQVQHRRPRFTACGLFTIDLSILSTMVAAVISYLIIIVQFQISNTNESGEKCSYLVIILTIIMIVTIIKITKAMIIIHL
ncbi:putative gustatory receptor 2a [Schistocerca serialis cubense]|uniref:putative gustatory receptor 2a n=1 Tax=Schistocerca serialis cubense TaxID=2023355 RepID=UPI00214E27A5|nr:putative gustatory receptor 2a [Schistocerca serialis cubense]